jgi:hypothetical protein
MSRIGTSTWVALCFTALVSACASAPPAKPAPKGPPGSEGNPVKVERMSDEFDYLQSHKCPGGGRYQMGDQSTVLTGEMGCMIDRISVTCTTSPEPAAIWFLHCM